MTWSATDIDIETQVLASGINQERSKIDIVLIDEDEVAEAISLKYQDVGSTA